MKTVISLVFAIIGIAVHVSGQRSIQLKKNEINIVPDTLEQSAGNPKKVYTVKLTFAVEGTFIKDTSLLLSLLSSATTSTKPVFLQNDSVKFTKVELNDSAGHTLTKIKEIVLEPVPSSEKKGEIFIAAMGSTNLLKISCYLPEKSTPPPALCSDCNITLKAETLSINPDISKTLRKVVNPVKIHFTTTGKRSTDTTIKIKLLSINTSSVYPVLLKPDIVVDPVKWNTHSFDTFVNLETNSVRDFDDDEKIYLGLDSGSGLKTVRITLEGRQVANKPFWIEVGSNFDFIDGLQPNNFAAGAFLYKRDIRPLPSFKGFGKSNPIKSASDSSKLIVFPML